MASPPASIPDSQLGLTAAEVQLLRHHQHVALAGSSRAASQASSQGRLLLDAGSLAALSAHFDRLIVAIQQQWNMLYQQTQVATQAQSMRAYSAVQDADAEIERYQQILQQIDELQTEWQKVARIGEIVKGMRARVEALDRRI
ncbi:hypothetical protein BT63DRAFT_413602 [Microthyrium microscopicum]|uniref:Biogenesis of lysosome-related organelles complex 1 subunit CNL1 n=1 Tax=Microthyrium microscopicum TaxID=703497 RepID=A0A6A6UA49_9PEZI|nr:hypothetical protein BT63DRAFT_413602 [Microthyrium microscopicum]